MGLMQEQNLPKIVNYDSQLNKHYRITLLIPNLLNFTINALYTTFQNCTHKTKSLPATNIQYPRIQKTNFQSTIIIFYFYFLGFFKSNYLQHSIIYRIMKKIVSALFSFGMAYAADIKLTLSQKNINGNSNSYELTCEGAQGPVQFTATGLPSGVSFNGSTFSISNSADVGNYPIRIKAIDATGKTIQKVIILSVNSSFRQIGVINENSNSNSNNNIVGGAKTNQQIIDQSVTSQQNNGQQSVSVHQIGRIQNNGGRIQNSISNIGLNVIQGSGLMASQSDIRPINMQTQGINTQPSQQISVQPNSNRLTNIISSYSNSSDIVRPTYDSSGRYPQPTFPSPTAPSGPNPIVFNINNIQANRSPIYRNPITADDVALRAASERHQNSIKGITNLLKIIDQGKANKDKAQTDIYTYTQAYNDAIYAQRSIQNEIINIENKSSQIVSAINNLSVSTEDLKKRINQILAQSDNLKKEKSAIIQTIAVNENQKAVLLKKLKGFDLEIGERVKQLSDKSIECQSLSNSIANKSTQLDGVIKELAKTEVDRANTVTDITQKTALVDNLRNQLQQAQKDLADAKMRLSDIDARRLALPNQIQKLKQELSGLEIKSRSCSQQIMKTKQRINVLKNQNIDGLTKQVNDIDRRLNMSRTRPSEIDAQLADFAAPFTDLQAKFNKNSEDLAFLRAQKMESDNNLRLVYQKGNDSNTRVATAKQNLDAIIKRFEDESKIISDGTMNLQKVRAEQALARLSLQQLIAHYTDALPYSIVPNGNLSTNPGTPFGNNPSGSALGQVQNNGNGSSGSFRINNWVSYLSSAYGAGVNPSFVGSVNQLFPFNFLSSVHGKNIINNYGNVRGTIGNNLNGYVGNINVDCSGKGSYSQQVTTGSIINMTDDSFDIQTNDGKILKVKVSACTKLNSNKADYQMKYGDQAVVKGYIYEGNPKAVESVQVTCLG